MGILLVLGLTCMYSTCLLGSHGRVLLTAEAESNSVDRKSKSLSCRLTYLDRRYHIGCQRCFLRLPQDEVYRSSMLCEGQSSTIRDNGSPVSSNAVAADAIQTQGNLSCKASKKMDCISQVRLMTLSTMLAHYVVRPCRTTSLPRTTLCVHEWKAFVVVYRLNLQEGKYRAIGRTFQLTL